MVSASALTAFAGPTIRRHRSEQAVSTPWEFIHAVEERFGQLAVDLAATAENAKAPEFITPEMDTFKQDWFNVLKGRWGWLNPEFDPMKKWVQKCANEQGKGAEFLVLSPASVGSNWFWDYVQPFATVYCLTPRIMLEGSKDVYPKDLILSHYSPTPNDVLQRWKWK